MQSNVERWLPVVGWEGLYEVSSWGRVRSLDRDIPRPDGSVQRRKGRLMRASINSKGYQHLSLHRNGGSTTRNVHTLVAEAFIGPRPENLQVRHGQGGQLDNRPENLCYGTDVENKADKLRDGTHSRGERHGQAKLTSGKVLEARRLFHANPQKTLMSRLAKEWGVSYSSLYNAVTGRTWRWLT